MRFILRLFPISRREADRAASVIASIDGRTLATFATFAVILTADAIMAVLVIEGRL